ncbi:MAG: transcriptional regulator [Meiothermus sp.]
MPYGAVPFTRPECAVERTLEVLSNRWTSLILRELLPGTRRWSELKSVLVGISPKTLAERLRILEEQGILTRTVYPEVPPRVEYTLTDKGKSLGPIFEAMREWGSRWA